MKIADLLRDEALRHHEFPVTREKVFLAHAAVCPLPRRVADAMNAHVSAAMLDDQEATIPAGAITRTRQLLASMTGAQTEEIALVGPTSLGLSYVAAGLRFRRNDNIIIYHDDYPSNVYPWMALAEKGVQVRFLNVRELGRIRDLDVLGQVDENTRLVALASNHFISGWRIDVDKIGRALRAKNILFCLDAIQTLGAFPVSLKHVDFMAADAHKWLLGPVSAGVLYVRKELQERLQPVVHGWHNVRCADYIAAEEIVFTPDARRYEAGSINIAGYLGFKAALELLVEVGVDNIANELLRKRAVVVPKLRAKGWTVLHAEAPEANQSGIITFHKDGEDLRALHQRLREQGLFTSLRTDRERRHYLRLSPHFYNTDEELQRVVDALP